jgi:hypothetical protein
VATITEMTTRVIADIPQGYDAALTAYETKITNIVTDCFWTIVRECRWWYLFKGLAVPTAGTESINVEINHLFYLLSMQHALALTGSNERSALFGSMYETALKNMNAKHGRKV